MILDDAPFKNRKPLPERLRSFGFREDAGAYIYTAQLFDGQFESARAKMSDRK